MLKAKTGVDPLLTERDVFDNPSRAARLAEAFYILSRNAHNVLFQEHVRPCIRQGMFAPTEQQRLAYSQEYLRVFGRDARIPARMAELCDVSAAYSAESSCRQSQVWIAA